MSYDIIKRAPNSVTWAKQEGDRIVIGESADVSGNLDRIKRMREANINSSLLGHVHVSIPLTELSAWCNSIGIGLDEAVADDAILDRFIVDGHGKFKVKGGWQ